MNNGLSRRRGVGLPRLDDTDRRIISELTTDGRVSFAELGRRVSLSAPAVAERVQRLERTGVITGYRAEVDPRQLGYQLTAIVRIKPAPGQLPRIPELGALLDRFLVYGETTTSLINASPIPRRDPPLVAD